MREWGVTAGEIVGHQMAAVNALRSAYQFDVLSQPLFWENVVASYLGGEVTAHQEPADVVTYARGRRCVAEVKFSQSFRCAFSPVRGRIASRMVFKWAFPRGRSGGKIADACIMIGRDESDLLYCWVVPLGEFSPRCKSVTLSTPGCRKDSRRGGRLDRWMVPFDQMLPEFLAICRGDI